MRWMSLGLCATVAGCLLDNPRYSPELAGESTQGAGPGPSTGMGMPPATDGTSGPLDGGATGASGDGSTSGRPADADDDAETGGDLEGPRPSDWWDMGWSQRRAITWKNLPPDAVEGFPARIDLDQILPENGFAPDGRDIRVLTANGEVLPFELARWSPRLDRATLWVRVPNLAGTQGTELWLYHDNPDADPAVDRPEAVWSDYQAVWHFSELTDASPNAHELEGSPMFDTGKINGALAVIPGVDPITLQDAATMSTWGETGLTLSGWVFVNNVDGPNARLLGKIANGNAFALDLVADDAGVALHLYEDGLGGPADHVSNETFGYEVWHHVAAVVDNADVALFIDGDPVGFETTDGSFAPTQPGAPDLGVGSDPAGFATFEGRIDELRIATVARPASWIAMERAMGLNPALVGPDESVDR